MSTTAPTTATAWADALDAEMGALVVTAGELLSWAYADGSVAGVSVDPNADEADDERAVMVSDTGWVVAYDAASRCWIAR